MVGVAIAVEEPHRQGDVVTFSYGGDQFASGCFIERNKHRAVGAHSFVEHITVAAFDERCREHDVEVVLLEPAFGAGFDYVSKPGSGDERGVSARALDQCICGEGGAVDDGVDL